MAKKGCPAWVQCLIVAAAILAAYFIGLWAGGVTGHNRAECEWSAAIQLWIDLGLEPRDPDVVMKERICEFKKAVEESRRSKRAAEPGS